MKARVLRHAELPPFGRRFDPETFDLRILLGSDHGLAASVMHSTLAPGRGPRRHRHPHAEVIAIHGGEATFDVDGEALDAVSGDIVLIPAGSWHRFDATGEEPLRLTAVHENPRAVTEWEDGTRFE